MIENVFTDITNDKFLNKNDYSNLKNEIVDMYNIIYDETLDISLIDTLFDVKYQLKKLDNFTLPQFETVEMRDNRYESLINNIKPTLTDILRQKTAHYDYLRNLPQPEQKSKEWFDLRNGMITASSAADILGEGKYGTREKMILDKLNILPNKYTENMFVYHGKKYELIATMIYEHLYNTKVGEFGLVPYQNDSSDSELVNFIGASPDGISTCVTLDNKPNPLVGRMLEIKCPLKREIEIKGPIDGTICPHYYWVQVQIQLACCKSEECDFWQCDIKEFSFDEFINEVEDVYLDDIATEEQGMNTLIHSNITKGCVIQLMPRDISSVPYGDKVEWYAKYIYPSNLKMNKVEYVQWIEYMQTEWKTLYPEYANKYYYDKPLYWKLHKCHNVLIKRDIEWFKNKLPIFKEFWNEILDLRTKPHEGKRLLDEYLNKENNKKDYSNNNGPKNSYKHNKSSFINNNYNINNNNNNYKINKNGFIDEDD